MALASLVVCMALNALLALGQEKQVNPNVDSFLQELYPGSSTTEAASSEESKESFEEPNKTPDGFDCQCLPYWQCNNTHGAGLIDIRTSVCKSYLEQCCRSKKVESEIEGGYSPKPTRPKPRERYGCGKRNENGVGLRITGDVNYEAQFGEFPWMVAVLKEEPCSCSPSTLINVYKCGGSLITPKVVLTAAHCVVKESATMLKIRAGEWDTQTDKEQYPHHDRRVREVIVHEEYFSEGLHNDVALLILDKPLEYKKNVDVTCLPQQDEVFDETECYATGWGKNVFGKLGKHQVILKKVALPTVHPTSCESALRKTRLGPHFELHKSFVCAGGEKGKDTCMGDGGSPLVCPIPSKPGHYAQAGIVAWGIGCGEGGTPGVYVNVAKFRHWIDSKLEHLDLDITPYDYSL